MTIMSCEFESHLLHEEVEIAEVAQLVEHNLAKVRVAGPSPVFRSKVRSINFGLSFYAYARTTIDTNKKKETSDWMSLCSAYGNRTRVPCVRGMCPSR